ncbi:unnamed protein product, partial [Didymodactylos carnosus]
PKCVRSDFAFKLESSNRVKDHSLLLQQQQPIHIQHLLDSIVDFSGINEDARTWRQRIELLFDLADYTKFKWIKLTALHLKDHALCWYNANKNKFHDWDVFCQMLKKQYTPTPMSTTTTGQTIEINDNNNLTIPAQNALLLTELTTG